jgi:hypothetical protein
MTKFAVEMQQDSMFGARATSYGKVHKAGCRDLRDPEEFESEPSQAAIDEAVVGFTGWEPSFELAPCARKLLA